MVRRVHYDLYYIDNRSLLLDLRTLWRTVGVVLRRPRTRSRTAAVPGSLDGTGMLGRAPTARESTVVKGVTQ
jgi:hypothetical protein